MIEVERAVKLYFVFVSKAFNVIAVYWINFMEIMPLLDVESHTSMTELSLL